MSTILLLFLLVLIVITVLISPSVTGGVHLAESSHENYILIRDVRSDNNIEYDDRGVKKTYNTFSHRYLPWSSQQQISQILKYGKNPDKAALIELFLKLKDPALSDLQMLELLYSQKSDQEIYQKILPTTDNQAALEARGAAYAAELFRHLQHLKIKKHPAILDIGCGTGEITKELGKILQAKSVSCVENDRELASSNAEYFIRDTQQSLPYKTGSMDLIFALHSFHHIEDLRDLLPEIKRVLNKNGFLVLKEHLCWDAFDAMLCDIEHVAYLLRSGRAFDQIGSGYSVPLIYANEYGWDEILSGFSWVSADLFKTRQKVLVSPTKSHVMIYKKH